MPPEQWGKVKNLFAEALDLPEDVRAALIEERCQGEPAVRAEVLRLLHYSPSREGHLDRAPLSPGLLQQAAQQAANYTPLQNGEVLAGRFRIIRRLDAGGMGEVYEAEDENLASRIAITTIRPEIAVDPQVLARFRREAGSGTGIRDRVSMIRFSGRPLLAPGGGPATKYKLRPRPRSAGQNGRNRH